MSRTRLSSIASGVSSPSSLGRRYPMISFLLGFTDVALTHPEKCFSISAQICGLPVINTRVCGDFLRICFSESRSLVRWTATHLSRASIHIYRCSEDVMACSIFTISGSCGPGPRLPISSCRKARDISSGNIFIPPMTCFNKEPRILVADCSFRVAKSK